MSKHECDEQTPACLDGHDAVLYISSSGHVEIEFEDADGMDGFIEGKFDYCPYCGVVLSEKRIEKPSIRTNCRCLNTYHGMCMKCGRSTQ